MSTPEGNKAQFRRTYEELLRSYIIFLFDTATPLRASLNRAVALGMIQ